MSTLTIADIPLTAEDPAQRLQRTAAAVRVSLRWLGTHRALSPQQKEEFGAVASADTRLLTAGKRIIDPRHVALRRLTAIRSRLGHYWHGVTLPYTEPGMRLIRRAEIESLIHTLEGFREELTQAAADLALVYDEIKADARRRLGRLYDPADYPERVERLFAVEWDFPSVEPPSYLLQVAPELYEEERRRIASRFEEAVRLAEQAFATEFARLLAHLTERLTPGEDGQRKVFRDSAVANLREFFGRFAALNVRSNAELDALVAEAQRLVQGVTPQELRDHDGLRRQIAGAMEQVRTRVEGLVVEAPRRRLVRTRPAEEGGSHAAAG